MKPSLRRRLGARDAALIVMGGIIGSGIFKNPSIVAKQVHTGPLMMLAWMAGGAIAMLGAALFAELAYRRPENGGLYAYMRDAYHPAVAFSYGWTLLLVSQSGGAAASAVTFAEYFTALTHLHAEPRFLASITIALFTLVNCFGVRSGATTQNAFMIAKIAAIMGLILVGLSVTHPAATASAVHPLHPLGMLGLALVPVLFAYSGWQTSSFMAGELRDPGRTLARGMLLGTGAVVVLYLCVNAIAIRALGETALAATSTPASDIVRVAFGPIGAQIMAAIVALSTLGFISNQILTSPRVYYQMAADGTFFNSLARLNPRTNVPVFAIALQGIVAMIVAFSNQYDAIQNYVTSVDWVFFGLAAIALMIFRKRDAKSGAGNPAFTMPGHPWTTALFLVIAWLVVGDVVVRAPVDALIGLGILLSGVPVYWLFTFAHRRAPLAR
ncbi:MAG: amino acid permease [Candidatus Eremiobacteraeota bacterium]|nr:amino acid permease [Candidatus Eremiobacteraeota bacterium]